MYEDDEGVWDRIRTTGSDRPVVCGNGFADGGIIDPHAECRIALDAAQDEIERLISEKEALRFALDRHDATLKSVMELHRPMTAAEAAPTPADTGMCLTCWTPGCETEALVIAGMED